MIGPSPMKGRCRTGGIDPADKTVNRADAVYPLIGARSPWSNLSLARQLFGDEEQTYEQNQRALCRNRRGQAFSSLLCAYSCRERRTVSTNLALRYNSRGPDPSSRMARDREDYACGDGEYGFLLDSHIQHSRGSLCRCAGESRGSQEPQRP